ncbi:hypothetical protein K438DRAFT_2034508 [Mycena galopus ATCC 62051]|nr:hypothetical protein K438DRAFT_2034508 [Mycena galopus ATCC 62051]
MDRPDVGDACAFPATSFHTSLAASFPCPVLAETSRKPVVLKAALPSCMDELITDYCRKRMAASGRHALPAATRKRSPPRRQCCVPAKVQDVPVAARMPSHPAVATLVIAAVVNITLSILTLSLSLGTSEELKDFVHGGHHDARSPSILQLTAKF